MNKILPVYTSQHAQRRIFTFHVTEVAIISGIFNSSIIILVMLLIHHSTLDMAYMVGLARCSADRGYFFVPNSLGEFTDVMAAVPDTGKQYFVGLQNWVRRGAGTTRETWNVAAGYTADTDYNWSWMDRDSLQFNTNASNFIAAVINSISVSVHKDMPYLSWKNIPNLDHLIMYFVYSSPNWEIDPVNDLGTEKRYICEISNACAQCPVGFYRYDQYCFQLFNTTSLFDVAMVGCGSGCEVIFAQDRELGCILTCFIC